LNFISNYHTSHYTKEDIEDTMSYDGEMEYDDKGIRVYWDAEEEGWIEAPEYATERFLKLLNSLDTFEGFDANANDDSDAEDSDDD
jgi:hypothetical protein